MKNVYRGAICKIEVLQGKDTLLKAQEKARRLYNFTRYCAIGFNRAAANARGESSLKGKLPKYPGKIGMWKALHDTEEYKSLNDRVANYVVRGFDQAMRSWFSNLKIDPQARPPGYAKNPPPLTFEIGRTAKWYDDGVVRLSVLPGDVENRFVYARVYLPPLTCRDRVESIKVLADGRCAISYRLDPKRNDGEGVAAIDLGIRQMATLVFQNGESILYPGGEYLSRQRYFQKRLARCMPSGYKGTGDGRKLPKSDKSRGYDAELGKQKSAILHNLTDSIIRECQARGVKTIVIGDLKGIRDDKDYGSQTNQQLHAWPFSKITTMVTYKAEGVGIGVEKISERNTSKTCSVCGHINKASARKVRGMLMCSECGAQVHADVNGAINILQKYLRERDDALGVVAGLPRQPSPEIIGDPAKRSFAKRPTFVARFDLRSFAVKLHQC